MPTCSRAPRYRLFAWVRCVVCVRLVCVSLYFLVPGAEYHIRTSLVPFHAQLFMLVSLPTVRVRCVLLHSSTLRYVVYLLQGAEHQFKIACALYPTDVELLRGLGTYNCRPLSDPCPYLCLLS